MLKQRHVNKQKDDFSSVLQQNVSTKRRFHKICCVRIAAAVDKINKMADCRLSRLEFRIPYVGLKAAKPHLYLLSSGMIKDTNSRVFGGT